MKKPRKRRKSPFAWKKLLKTILSAEIGQELAAARRLIEPRRALDGPRLDKSLGDGPKNRR